MSHILASTPLVNDTVTIEHVTIVADVRRSELVVTIEHTPEDTRNEHGEVRCVEMRTFRSHVACPVSAARQLARNTYIRHPMVPVELVNA